MFKQTHQIFLASVLIQPPATAVTSFVSSDSLHVSAALCPYRMPPASFLQQDTKCCPHSYSLEARGHLKTPKGKPLTNARWKIDILNSSH